MTILDEPTYRLHKYLSKYEWNLENLYLYSYEDNSHQFIYNVDQYDDEDFYDVTFKAKIQIRNEHNYVSQLHIKGVYHPNFNDSEGYSGETIGFNVKKAEFITEYCIDHDMRFHLRKFNINPDREQFYEQDGIRYDLFYDEIMVARFLREKLSIGKILIEKIKRMQKMINTGE